MRNVVALRVCINDGDDGRARMICLVLFTLSGFELREGRRVKKDVLEGGIRRGGFLGKGILVEVGVDAVETGGREQFHEFDAVLGSERLKKS